ncbi:MAG: Mur ligase domain-containing protein, partial [Brevinema sp.]
MIGEMKILFNNQFFEKALHTKATNNHEFCIRYFSIDSRINKDTALYCFVGIRGHNVDGNDFFQDAYNHGVRVFVLQKLPQNIPMDAVIYLVEDTILALAALAKKHKNNLIISSLLITG